MGILDFASRVTTTYKADVNDHIKELRKLKGEEKERAKAMLDEQRKINDGLEGQIKTIGKVGLAVGAAVGIATLAWHAYQETLEHSRLKTAAAGADIEGLRKASLGLKTEMQLLSEAARFQSGAFRLNQHQMEIAERAMLALTRRGFDAAKANEAVTQAVTVLKTEGLQDLGIFIDKAGASMETAEGRAKILTATMSALAKVSVEVKDGQRTAAEGVQAAAVTLGDSWSQLKRSLGELVIEFQPLISALAQVASYAAQIARYALRPDEAGRDVRGAIVKGLRYVSGQTQTHEGIEMGPTIEEARALVAGHRAEWIDAADPMKGLTYLGTEETQRRLAQAADNERSKAESARIAAQMAEGSKRYQERLKADQEKAKRDREAAAAAARSRDEEMRALVNREVKAETDELVERLEREIRERDNANAMGRASDSLASGIGSGRSGWDADVDSALKKFYGAGGEQDRRTDQSYGEFQAGKAESFLSKSFGPIEEFNAYGAAFGMLTGAVTSAMSAWIDGSMSAGDAVKKFIGEAIKGLAVQAAMQALHHGAFALGHLAFGDMIGFGRHGKAAAAFAGVAVAAAAAAKGLGGGSVPSVGAGASGGAGAQAPSGGPPAGSGGGNTYVVVYGAPDADNSPYMTQRNARKLVTRVMGSPGVS
jgi:hypothetical protein